MLELIEKLYKDGKITFAEAMALSNNSLTDLKEDFPMKDAKIGRENICKQIIDDFIKEIVDEYYCEELPNENLAFDSEKCVEAMKANNWEWYGIGIPPVSKFKENLRNSVKRIIDSCIRKYKNQENADNDYYSGEECGGIKVEGWITPDTEGKPELQIKCEFILEQGEYILENKNLKEIL